MRIMLKSDSKVFDRMMDMAMGGDSGVIKAIAHDLINNKCDFDTMAYKGMSDFYTEKVLFSERMKITHGIHESSDMSLWKMVVPYINKVSETKKIDIKNFFRNVMDMNGLKSIGDFIFDKRGHLNVIMANGFIEALDELMGSVRYQYARKNGKSHGGAEEIGEIIDYMISHFDDVTYGRKIDPSAKLVIENKILTTIWMCDPNKSINFVEARMEIFVSNGKLLASSYMNAMRDELFGGIRQVNIASGIIHDSGVYIEDKTFDFMKKAVELMDEKQRRAFDKEIEKKRHILLKRYLWINQFINRSEVERSFSKIHKRIAFLCENKTIVKAKRKNIEYQWGDLCCEMIAEENKLIKDGIDKILKETSFLKEEINSIKMGEYNSHMFTWKKYGDIEKINELENYVLKSQAKVNSRNGLKRLSL